MHTTLDKRITVATFLVATLVMALFALVIAVASGQIEHEVLDQLVIQEFGLIQRNLASGKENSLPNTAQLRSWLTKQPDAADLPRELRRLPAGIHHEIRIADSQYHVLREPVEDGFLTLAYEIDLVESRETQFKFVLLVTVLLAPVLLMWLSTAFTRRMTVPVTRLAEKLKTLDPMQRRVRVGSEFQGQEVEAIAQAFDRYQERLDVMVERELSFSAAASHELRSPLAVIGASAELMENLESLPVKAQGQLARITQAVNQMAEVVDSLLALSRDHTQKLIAPLHVKAAVVDAMANFRMQLAGKKVSLEFECDEQLSLWVPMGDFLVILNNLVQNAIRNTESGSIRVLCDSGSLVVRDTGRGMPRQFANHIFDKHVQAHDSHGAGLGLHIVKRFCDRHGWVIEVDSALGEGTTVTVHWARGAAAARSADHE